MSEIECVLDAKSILGEGALWDVQDSVLYWVDIKRREIHRFDPASGQRRALVDAGGRRIARGARGRRPGRGDDLRLSFLRSRERPLRGDRRSRAGSPREPLQRRQAGPARPVLGRHHARSRDHGIRRALPPRPRPALAQDGRGRHGIERPRLEPGGRCHVLRLQQQPDGLGVRFRPGRRHDRQPARVHRHARDRRRARWRDGRRGGLLLADPAGRLEGRALRSQGPADPGRSSCRSSCRPARRSAARSWTCST